MIESKKRFTRKQRGGKQEPIILLQLRWGLGNQIIQYCIACAVQKHFGYKIFILPAIENVHTTKDYRDLFIRGERINEKPATFIDPYVADKNGEPLNISEIPSGKNIFLERLAHSYEVFSGIMPELARELHKTLETLYPDLPISNSRKNGFIHVRRGDFVNNGWDKGFKFYNSALKLANKRPDLKVKTWYLFSDDLEWCKAQKWDNTIPVEMVDESNEMKALAFMSRCLGGAILAQSTFAWAGAILGAYQYKESPIIAPVDIANGIGPSDWIYLNNDETNTRVEYSIQKGAKTRKHRRISQTGGSTPDRCVIVHILGGLGNQLFTYAAGIVTKNKLNLPLCMINNKDNPHTKTNYIDLLFKQGVEVNISMIQDRLNKSQRIFNNLSMNNPHNNWRANNVKNNTIKNIYMKNTYYQNYEKIQSAVPIIRKDLTDIFQMRYSDLKEEFSKKDEGSNKTLSEVSAFMHVRKGDYKEQALPSEYYQHALNELQKDKNVKHLYILSNDIKWSKEQNWNFYQFDVRWIDEPDELRSFYIMMLCIAGAIISASTFSSWGVILGANQNESATIIYPSKWVTGSSSKLKFPGWWKSISGPGYPSL